jgi:cytochrome d ubiquinol oxidase subunit II
VWLLAGGGTLYFAFPALYAASFSGFYLPCRPGMAID